MIFFSFKKQNEQRQRRRDETAAGTTWELKHFVHEEDDPLCMSFFFVPVYHQGHLLSPHALFFPDERLGRLFKAVPPTEEVYVFQNNGPTFDAA